MQIGEGIPEEAAVTTVSYTLHQFGWAPWVRPERTAADFHAKAPVLERWIRRCADRNGWILCQPQVVYTWDPVQLLDPLTTRVVGRRTRVRMGGMRAAGLMDVAPEFQQQAREKLRNWAPPPGFGREVRFLKMEPLRAG